MRPSTSTAWMPATPRTQPASPDRTSRCRATEVARRSSGAAGRDDPAAGQHDEALAEPLDEVELVGGEEDRHAARGVLAQQVGHVVDGGRVEAAERLVEHEGARAGP